jgi:chemotaxis protein CheD
MMGAATRNQSGEGQTRPVHVVQGEYHVTADPQVVLTTILGSCVAACICDPVAQVGGMNHFLLPGDVERTQGGESLRYGAYSMELLINGLLRLGAQRHRLEGKLFGGGRMLQGLTDVGNLNAAFAERFLKDENITNIGGSLRGDRGRRIQFWPTNGRARQIFMEKAEQTVFQTERRAPPPVVDHDDSVELF